MDNAEQSDAGLSRGLGIGFLGGAVAAVAWLTLAGFFARAPEPSKDQKGGECKIVCSVVCHG